MKVSIITSCYNCENTIKDTIESVLAQSYQDWELIIVDDGSKDKSVEVINPYCKKDKRIKLFKNNKNLGLKKTIIKALSKASCDWIHFLECDDILKPDGISKKLEVINKYPEVSFVFSEVEMFGDKICIDSYKNYMQNRISFLHNQEFPSKLILKCEKSINPIATFSSVMCKKDILLKCSFESSIDAWLDWFLWSQLGNENFYYIKEPLTMWRISSGSYGQNFVERENKFIIQKYYLQIEQNLKNKNLFERFIELSALYAKQIFSIRKSDDYSYKIYTIFGKDKKLPNQQYKPIKKFKERLEFPIFENPIVSIIIPVYNQYGYTLGCLNSILKYLKNISYEIIIADDCSTDETKNIQKNIKNIRVIKTNQNLGFLKNCNNASRFARGEYLWFLNNDTQIFYNTLESLLETFKKVPDAGYVGSMLLYNSNKIQEAGGIIYSDATGYNFGRNKQLRYDVTEYDYLKEVDYCSGASFLIKKELWDEMNGFDEQFAPGYYEETDLCFRIRQKGFKVLFQPNSKVMHFESVSYKDSHNQMMRTNREKFYNKWKETLKFQCMSPSQNFKAKDRSFNKKVLLYFDENILMPDTNCGDRASFQYLKFFVNMGYNVKFISRLYKRDPYKIDYLHKYVDQIQQLGVEIILDSNFSNWIKEYGKYVDFAFVNRPVVWQKYEKYFKEHNIKTMYQGHDIHYIREMRQAKLSYNKKKLKKAKILKNVEKYIWKRADYVFYFSQKEIDIVKEFNKNSYAIPLYLYKDNANRFNYEASTRKDLLFAGGFNHMPNADAMIWFIDKIFPGIKSIIPEIKIYIVGSNVPKELYKKHSDSIIFTGYITNEELINLYKSVRLSVVPLRFGAGVKGKIIEAIQNGIPVVTTDIGVEGINYYEDIITVANTEQEFINKVVSLYNDTEKLNVISSKSEDFIMKGFSENTARHIFEKIMI